MNFGKMTTGAASVVAGLLFAGSASAAEPYGVWMNDTGRGAIEIKDCDGKLCGHVVWVKDKSDTEGCGRQIIGEASKVGRSLWDNGWIYSPERKKRYDLELKALGDDRLRVKGYAGVKFLSKTMIWTRAPDDLERCGDDEQAATTGGRDEAAPSKPERVTREEPSSSSRRALSLEEIRAQERDREARRNDDRDNRSRDSGSSNDSVASNEPEEEKKGGLDVSSIRDKIGDVIQKDGDGNCKLDLPWVKLDFQCDKD